MKFLDIRSSAVLTITVIVLSIVRVFGIAIIRISDTSQLEYVINQSISCKKAAELAKSDFEKGSYLLIQFGLAELTGEITGEVLRRDYGIVQQYAGCAPIDEVECYTQKMYSLLQKKFGTEFYKKAKAKAMAQQNMPVKKG